MNEIFKCMGTLEKYDKDYFVKELVSLFTNSEIAATAAGGIFTFKYGKYVVGKYTPTELMEAAHNADDRVKTRYSAELNAAFWMYRYFQENPVDFDFIKQKTKDLSNKDISYSRQTIFYGAPGTGKSYKTNEVAKKYSTIRTTFHPDSDYSTFVGAYKPTTIKSKSYGLNSIGETKPIVDPETGKQRKKAR